MSLYNRITQPFRSVYRATLNQIQATYGAFAGYSAATLDRFTKGRVSSGSTSENVIPHEHYARLRWQAWKLYRDNPYFRKITRNLCAKVVGNGLTPRSLAMKHTSEGDVPATNFRLRAQQLWKEQSAGIDFTGLPGEGGETQAGMERMALIAVMLSGETLFKIRPITEFEQRQRGLPSPVMVQLIDVARLADDVAKMNLPTGHVLYRGIELNGDRRRVRYWLRDYLPAYMDAAELSHDAKPYPANTINHVFVKDDIDQLRGVSWFAPMLNQARDTNDLQYNMLKAEAVKSCVVMGYRLSGGKTRFGQAGSATDDLTDDNGNKIERMSSAMVLNLGKDGDVKMFSPAVAPGGEGFITFLLRGISGAIPGTKSSTVTGDYRNSSFSSERSADNDAWPELESVQAWFATAYCQPIYEAVVSAAVADGYFDGIISAAEFTARKSQYLQCDWQGPVARSINPVDDVQAAAMRIKSGISTPQIEAAKVGMRIEDILHAVADFRQMASDKGLPEVYVSNVLGLDTQDLISTAETAAATANGGSNVTKD